jgi:hypothetical protein
MLRPLSLLPALVAVVATASPAVAGEELTGDPTDGQTTAAERAVTSRSQARTVAARAVEEDPLAVTIRQITPSTLPTRGPIVVTGSVTNRSQEVWTSINLHAFVGSTPMTTSEELAEAVETDPAEYVGDRITTTGTFGQVTELAPGQSSSFSIQVPRAEIAARAPGVYWFGVHAIGDSTTPRDSVADGRARTFIPLVPRSAEPVPTALVIPLRRQLVHEGDGSIADVEGWAEDLSPGGALDSLLAFGVSAGSRPVSWLVDPAVPDAVRSLVAGNPPRSLEDTIGPEEPGGEEGEQSPSASPTQEPAAGEEGGGEQPAPPTNPATEPGAAWLSRLPNALGGDDVLALPYGDVDVSAAAERDADAYLRARQRTGSTLEPWGIATRPAVASPGGYLDPAAIPTVRKGTTMLVSDRMFPDGAPPVARVEGRRLTPTSWSTEQGGPLPGDRHAALAMRQRILAEAAVRSLDPEPSPLVVVLPYDWHPDSTLGFFDGLDVDWVDLTSVSDLPRKPAVEIAAEEIEYPLTQVRRELDAANFASAAALAGLGETLQNVLTRNDTVAAAVGDESLTTLSYASRADPNAARADADHSRAWISTRLASITVDAPRAVTLASNSGRFAATVTNRLDHPVTVTVQALSDEPMTIDAPETIDVAADSSTSVLLEAATDQLGVHNVELLVTDQEGTPLGSTDELPIRSVQVSQVIWVIMGTGVALLFGAIAVRLFRRIRRAAAR